MAGRDGATNAAPAAADAAAAAADAGAAERRRWREERAAAAAAVAAVADPDPSSDPSSDPTGSSEGHGGRKPEEPQASSAPNEAAGLVITDTAASAGTLLPVPHNQFRCVLTPLE